MTVPQARQTLDNEQYGRFAASYVRLCQKQGRSVCLALDVREGDWVVGPDGLRLVTDPSSVGTDEVLVPDLERVLGLLRAEAPSIILDHQGGDIGVSVFDDLERPLANVVSLNAPEACLRALLFVQAERKAAEMEANTIHLTPAPRSHG